MKSHAYLDGLNPAQRAAVEHGVAPPGGPLLVLAGAGSGKTDTLACRVAHLVLSGADPRRLLLLTFTRRAAREMTRRARHMVARSCSGNAAGAAGRRGWGGGAGQISWSGTFHSIANRLLRLHAESVGLAASFTVLDRSDSEDLMDLLRDEMGFSRKQSRFPKKATCLAIYSQAVNAQRSIAEVLARGFPWCQSWAGELRVLFRAYVEAKQRQSVLDYDDLLLYWHQMMAEPWLAAAVRGRFDHVLVDEYQDTNALQAAILRALRPDGSGLTVVGDDAQSIYSFRAATVRNILDFPRQFDPPARVVTLERNYRSTEAILQACNAVIGLSREGFAKKLFSTRLSLQKPVLVTAEDETCQVDYVVKRVLEHREAGIDLRRQAVLFRAAHHSDQLEVELGRRKVPFVKYGGLRFLEAAHVKDVLCALRWADNPRDSVAAFRVLQLLPGMGPKSARGALVCLERKGFDLAAMLEFAPPPPAAGDWGALCALLLDLHGRRLGWPEEVGEVREWYMPHLERLYDSAQVRAADLEQLEQIAASYPSRERFLTEVTLDPPGASGDEAGAPWLDEDFLVLSTIHSAKGQEWDVVYVLNVVDGCIPSDMAAGSPEGIEEERRLLYVAMTRARNHLHLVCPFRFFAREQRRHGDRHVYAPRSRFIPDSILEHFERRSQGRDHPLDSRSGPGAVTPIDVGARVRASWG